MLWPRVWPRDWLCLAMSGYDVKVIQALAFRHWPWATSCQPACRRWGTSPQTEFTEFTEFLAHAPEFPQAPPADGQKSPATMSTNRYQRERVPTGTMSWTISRTFRHLMEVMAHWLIGSWDVIGRSWLSCATDVKSLVAFSRLASKRSWQFGPQHGPYISHSNKQWRFPKSWGVPPNHPRLVIVNGKTNGLGYRSHILGTPPSPKLRHLGPSCAKRLAAEAFHSLWQFERKLHSSLWPGHGEVPGVGWLLVCWVQNIMKAMCLRCLRCDPNWCWVSLSRLCTHWESQNSQSKDYTLESVKHRESPC